MTLARWSKPLTLVAMCLGLFMPQLDTTVVNLALSSIQHSLHTDVGALQWIIDGYNLTFAALLFTGGTLGDLFGRKRLFLLGLLVFVGGSLLCGLTPAFPILLLGRILQGIGATLELPATLAIVTIIYADPKERAWAMSIWASIAGVALAVGPTADAFLLNVLGWQSIFFVNIPVGLFAVVLALWAVGESVNPQGRQIDLPGQTLAALFLIVLTDCADLYRDRESGMASGLSNVARMVGATLGVAILGALLASQLVRGHSTVHFMAGLRVAFLVGGSIELLGCVLAWLCIPRTITTPTAKADPKARIATHI